MITNKGLLMRFLNIPVEACYCTWLRKKKIRNSCPIMVRFPNASVSYNLLNPQKEFSQFIGLPQARISIDKTPC